MKVGLDFGTTNSLVSYWDEQAQEVKLFEFHDKVITPTALVYGFQNQPIAIGQEAIQQWSNDYSLKLRRFFKTDLNSEDKHEEARNYCHDFIRYLLKDSNASFEKNHQKITDLVVSVPELWQKEPKNLGATNLLRAIYDTELPIKTLVSEPLSALAYYCWKNPDLINNNKKILVCDMGGGTSDLSYCAVERNNDNRIIIDVIAYDGSQGKSGVYDIEQILTNWYKKNNKQPDNSTDDFQKNLWQLDIQIQSETASKDIIKNYPEYIKNPAENNSPIFSFSQQLVFSEQIYSAFPAIEKDIIELLDKIKTKCEDELDFDYLLFIGGFSNYFLVRNTILNYFKLQQDDEKVKAFPLNDSKRAVAYGAALIAADKIDIREYYRHSIIFYGYEFENNNRKIKIPMIKYGHPFHPDEVIWDENNTYEINNAREITLEGEFLQDNRTRLDFRKKFALNWIGNHDTKCRLGIKISRANTVTLVIRSLCKQFKREINLGELLD